MPGKDTWKSSSTVLHHIQPGVDMATELEEKKKMVFFS